jgi:H+/gluconate symporter-like permease
MLRRLNPELSLGFAIASLFWIAVLGWQSSYSLPENEKQRCYEETKKPGHKDEECKTFWERTTSDPIAFFTFTLSIVTLVLGAISVRQFHYLKRSDETARVTANAALRQANAMIAIESPIFAVAR